MQTARSLRWLLCAGLFAAAAGAHATALVIFKPSGGPHSFGGKITFTKAHGAKGIGYLKYNGVLAFLPAGKTLVRLQRSCSPKLPPGEKDVFVLADAEPGEKGALKMAGHIEGLPMGGGRGERGAIGMSLLVLNASGAPIACRQVLKLSK